MKTQPTMCNNANNFLYRGSVMVRVTCQQTEYIIVWLIGDRNACGDYLVSVNWCENIPAHKEESWETLYVLTMDTEWAAASVWTPHPTTQHNALTPCRGELPFELRANGSAFSLQLYEVILSQQQKRNWDRVQNYLLLNVWTINWGI